MQEVRLTVIVLSAAILVGVGCGHGATACAVVDVADTACDVLPIRYLDDDGQEQTARVPMQELRAAAVRAQKQDGGAP